jgi:4'-phosphopantetheinyl transferase
MNNIIFQVEKIPENFNEARYLPVLNREESFRYKKFSDVSRKRQFLFSRFILKNKLFELTGKNADEIHFEIGPHGKPFIEGLRIHFSISHSENYVAYVIAKKEVGLDIQTKRDFSNLDGLIKKVCHGNEATLLSQSKDIENDFLKLWSLKEAYSKCTGLGIQAHYSKLNFSQLLENPFTEDSSPTIAVENKNYEVQFKILERTQKLYVAIFKESH